MHEILTGSKLRSGKLQVGVNCLQALVLSLTTPVHMVRIILKIKEKWCDSPTLAFSTVFLEFWTTVVSVESIFGRFSLCKLGAEMSG